jgi:hypothetical protein
MKGQTMKRIPVRIAIIILSLLAFTAAGTSIAQASTYDQICDSANFCANAWNGGPSIATYGNDVINDAFQINSLGNGVYDIESQITGLYIGDNNNNPGDAKASEIGYNGWGTYYTKDTSSCLAGSFALKNRHWGGYLGGASFNGSRWYLNNFSPTCYSVSTFNA